MIFKTDVKPWNKFEYNSLVCNRPNHPIEPIKGDFIDFNNRRYIVCRTVNTLVLLKGLADE